MKRKLIAIDQKEFVGQPIYFSTPIDFTGAECVVFVTKTSEPFGGVSYDNAYLAQDITVEYADRPLAQAITIGTYGTVPLDEEMKVLLLPTGFADDDVPERDERIYSATTINQKQ